MPELTASTPVRGKAVRLISKTKITCPDPAGFLGVCPLAVELITQVQNCMLQINRVDLPTQGFTESKKSGD